MQKTSTGTVVYSPTDLIRFMKSPYSIWMDRFHLECPGVLVPDENSAQNHLIAGEGNKHEHAYLEQLRRSGTNVIEIRNKNFSAAVEATRVAIQGRSPIIYQAALQLDEFAGYSDFIILGADDVYEIWDTKLGRSPKPYYLVQLCCYAELLGAITGIPSTHLGVVLVSNQDRMRTTGNPLDLRRFRANDYSYYYRSVKHAFLRLMADFIPDPASHPLPGARADHGRWRSHADAWIKDKDHLSKVAKITSGQIKKLETAEIGTLAALGNLGSRPVAQIAQASLLTLVQQARIQLVTRQRREGNPEAQPAFEVLTCAAGEKKGLAALPRSDQADIYFDMEGFPLVVGGLEYLFGACYQEGGKLLFRDWWGHDRSEEKQAFEGFIDWAFARWRSHPALHIYHYAAYEVSALRRLSTGHATREDEVDQLLRNEVFVDLYQIVRQGILLGEDSYSIKKVELLYRGKRQGEVSTAGDSIVEYANWIASGESGDPSCSTILKAIRDYNEDDCRSTAELVDWLRRLQNEHQVVPAGRAVTPIRVESEAVNNAASSIKTRLLEAAYDQNGKLVRHDFETLAYLLDFHRREDKPMWWRKFDRIAASFEELANDIACLASVRVEGDPTPEKRSLSQSYSFSPDEDTKLTTGSKVMFTHEATPKFEVVNFDQKAGRLKLKISSSKLDEFFGGRFPRSGSLIPDEFVSPDPIPAAVARAAEALLTARHPLLANLLERKAPLSNGGVLVAEGESSTEAAIRIAGLMDNSLLCIQGPPGTGKTYTGSQVIAALLTAGKRVGIMSNSHKAILNLVRATGKNLGVDKPLIGIKIGGDSEDPIFTEFSGLRPIGTGKEALTAYQKTGGLVAGTAWPFSREEWDGALDYLVIDEAGQVSLANLVGVSLAAKNLILLGDQMQLEQPIQGTHPGATGNSALQYYLQNHATIPPDLGIFLDRSFRMHPDVCRFISETVYESRLTSVDATAYQRITLKPSGEIVKKESGIQFVSVEHDGNVQASDEEIDRVIAIFSELNGCRFRSSEGESRTLSLDDFLFISPYNLQVNRLQSRLPEGARVGSVDKFQGQEAPVAIFSFGSSYGEYGSRGLSFLLDRNRINVAISRAQCLAIVVGDPRIAHTDAHSLEDMTRINLFCRLAT